MCSRILAYTQHIRKLPQGHLDRGSSLNPPPPPDEDCYSCIVLLQPTRESSFVTLLHEGGQRKYTLGPPFQPSSDSNIIMRLRIALALSLPRVFLARGDSSVAGSSPWVSSRSSSPVVGGGLRGQATREHSGEHSALATPHLLPASPAFTPHDVYCTAGVVNNSCYLYRVLYYCCSIM